MQTIIDVVIIEVVLFALCFVILACQQPKAAAPRSSVSSAAALDLVERRWAGLQNDVVGEWDALVRRTRRARGTVIISHEILAGARPKQVARAMTDLGEAQVHLVLSARDLARQIPAEWQENVKHRRVHTFDRFLTQVQGAARRNPKMWFWRAQSLPDVLTQGASAAEGTS